MRKLQRGSILMFAEGPRRERAWQNFRRQERFARKYGLQILTTVITFCLYTVAMLIIYKFLNTAFEQGWLPSRVSETDPE